MIRLALGLALLSGVPARAEHRPFSIDQMSRTSSSFLRQNAASVSYYGGPVISHAKVILVFWGTGVAPETQARLESFYRGIVDSTYMDQLAEYETNVRAAGGGQGTKQTIGRGSLGGVTTITPINKSSRLTQADVEAELDAQIKSGALPKPDADNLYMLHYPDGYRISISFGVSCSNWDADHEFFRSKSAGPVYYAMFPCGSDGFDNLTFAVSHELVEAVTDPMSPLQNEPMAFPAGWLRSDAQEIADLCTGSRGTFIDGNARYSVNPVWLNSRNGCAPGNFSRQPFDPRIADARFSDLSTNLARAKSVDIFALK